MTLPPLYLQLAGPAARPSGHPGHAFVLPELAVGEYPTPDDAVWLRQRPGIDAVVSLQDDIDLERKGLDLRALEVAYAAQGIAFHRIPVTDGEAEMLRAHIDALVSLLDGLLRAGRRVYLHCNAGLNRAPTVAIAYLHVHRGHRLDAARDLVKARRPCVPFMRMLAAHYGG
ncbi:MAG: dual specificity protein phosphatase family protein [Candidatus Binatia bacterium]